MNRFGNLPRPPLWSVALLLAAVVAGCGSAGEDGGADVGLLTAAGAGSGVGGLGRGPEPVNLRTAGNFAILAEEAIRDVSPSQVIGDVGLTPREWCSGWLDVPGSDRTDIHHQRCWSIRIMQGDERFPFDHG